MRRQREKSSDTRTFTAAALLMLVRLALAFALAYLLTFLVFDTSLQLVRLLVFAALSLLGLLAAGLLLRQYRFLLAFVLHSFCLAAVIFLGIAWRFHASHIPARSFPAEIITLAICITVVGYAILFQRFQSKRRRKA
jgi:hypothetical protein